MVRESTQCTLSLLALLLREWDEDQRTGREIPGSRIGVSGTCPLRDDRDTRRFHMVVTLGGRPDALPSAALRVGTIRIGPPVGSPPPVPSKEYADAISTTRPQREGLVGRATPKYSSVGCVTSSVGPEHELRDTVERRGLRRWINSARASSSRTLRGRLWWLPPWLLTACPHAMIPFSLPLGRLQPSPRMERSKGKRCGTRWGDHADSLLPELTKTHLSLASPLSHLGYTGQEALLRIPSSYLQCCTEIRGHVVR